MSQQPSPALLQEPQRVSTLLLHVSRTGMFLVALLFLALWYDCSLTHSLDPRSHAFCLVVCTFKHLLLLVYPVPTLWTRVSQVKPLRGLSVLCFNQCFMRSENKCRLENHQQCSSVNDNVYKTKQCCVCESSQ